MKRGMGQSYSHRGVIIGDTDSPDSYRDREHLTNKKQIINR
jgi:hypothetical protein